MLEPGRGSGSAHVVALARNLKHDQRLAGSSRLKPTGDPAMIAPVRRTPARWSARFGILAMLVATAGCAGGQPVTPEAVTKAKRLWAEAKLRDYDLEWSVGGRNNAHYAVTVRDGDVRKIESIQPDGSKLPMRPGDPKFYSVDGLFLTIDNELALLETDRPFDEPKGTTVVMRFLPDAKLGYPRWYHRDVMGTPLSIAIEVNALTPVPSASKSP